MTTRYAPPGFPTAGGAFISIPADDRSIIFEKSYWTGVVWMFPEKWEQLANALTKPITGSVVIESGGLKSGLKIQRKGTGRLLTIVPRHSFSLLLRKDEADSLASEARVRTTHLQAEGNASA